MRAALRALVLACLALLVPRGAAVAGGEVTRATLSWVRLPGAEGCAAAPALAEAVERRLGHPVFSPASTATLSVEGWVEPAQRPLRWRAIVTAADARGKVLGSREILTAAPDCAEIVAPLALGIALMIDPEAPPPAPEESPPEAVVVAPDPGPEPPPASPQAPRAPLDPPQSAPAPRGALLQVTLGPLVGVGALPGVGAEMVSPGSLLRLVLGPPAAWGLELQAALFPLHEVRDAAFLRGHAAVLGCPVRRILAVRIDLCAGLATGVMAGGDGPAAPLLDALLEVRAGHRFGGSAVVLSFGASLGVPLLPWSMESGHPLELTLPADGSAPSAGGGRTVYTSPPVYGMADLALGFEAP